MLAARSAVTAAATASRGALASHGQRRVPAGLLVARGSGHRRRNLGVASSSPNSGAITITAAVSGSSRRVAVPAQIRQQQTRTAVTVTTHDPPGNTAAATPTGAATTSSPPSAPVVDLRSDTVTKPCKRLREAMAGATVGDDVFGEDPTVSRLEDCVAFLLGKEKGLLVPSGTMGNLIAVGVHCRRGDEIILGDKAHIFKYEATAASAFMGVAYHTVRNSVDGGLEVADIEAAVRGDDIHYPRSSLVCLENTQNLCGARAIGPQRMAEMCAAAHGAGLKVHVDGARLWNAATALEVRPSGLVADADSVSVCLSKGLGAPVGSVLVGSEEFIYEARRLRKALGGGMRQAGILAAAGLEAVVNNYVRLSEDHDNAAALANGLAGLPGIRAERSPGATNAVYFQVEGMDAQTFVDSLKRDHGVLMGSGYFGGSTIRAMTHRDVDREGVERAIEASRVVLAAGSEYNGGG